MNFLVDANLPPRLCVWLRQRGHGASHLIDLQSLRLADKLMWKVAASRQEIIVSKDMDFYERALLLGKPPQVLLIALGNCSNDDLIAALDSSWKNIDAELTAGARLVTLRPGRLEVLA